VRKVVCDGAGLTYSLESSGVRPGRFCAVAAAGLFAATMLLSACSSATPTPQAEPPRQADDYEGRWEDAATDVLGVRPASTQVVSADRYLQGVVFVLQSEEPTPALVEGYRVVAMALDLPDTSTVQVTFYRPLPDGTLSGDLYWWERREGIFQILPLSRASPTASRAEFLPGARAAMGVTDEVVRAVASGEASPPPFTLPK